MYNRRGSGRSTTEKDQQRNLHDIKGTLEKQMRTYYLKRKAKKKIKSHYLLFSVVGRT